MTPPFVDSDDREPTDAQVQRLLDDVRSIPADPVGPHLDDEELFCLATGRLSEHSRVMAHIESCASCAADAVEALHDQATQIPATERAEPAFSPRERETWLRVELPGRPNEHRGWIVAAGTRSTTTPWQLRVDVGERRVSAVRGGRVVRRFPAIVGTASTPTPVGDFFVEENVRLSAWMAGAPYALALSARSEVLQEFAGGPGQIALHGRGNVGGVLGTAASHGCIRLDDTAIAWLARRILPGTPVTVTR